MCSIMSNHHRERHRSAATLSAEPYENDTRNRNKQQCYIRSKHSHIDVIWEI